MLMRHLRLPGITSYTKAATIQQKLVTQFLTHKASKPHCSSSSSSSPPPPTLITAEFSPVYTCGRREIDTLTATQQAHLRHNGTAEFHQALRGGQTTFHGPGQLTAYAILDLKQHNLAPRTYVCLLQQTVMRVCAAYGITATTTANPGVWITPDDKICALGVHLRRNVASHGVGLNVHTDLSWFGRIVACGLEGKRTTSFEREGVVGVGVQEVAGVFARLLAEALEGVEGVDEVTEESLF